MKAIETVYKGYRFRSRLEARWAVFFDALGIEWVYEPEGFILDDGTMYLPDFWLSTVDMWAEVKPTESDIDENKIKSLAKESGRAVFRLIGTPENKPYWATHYYQDDSGFGDYVDFDYCFTNYHNYPKNEGRFYVQPGDYGVGGDAYWDDTERAARIAKSARFEHGEHGEYYGSAWAS